MGMPLLEVNNLVKHFKIGESLLGKGEKIVHAVDGVSFSMNQGETLGIVGESGCGKTTLGRLVLNLIRPTSGNVLFDGHDLCKMKKKELQKLRRHMGIVFQDPYASLNPRMSVRTIIERPMKIHGISNSVERRAKIKELVSMVNLAEEQLDRFPHEFSGGQRQRIAIAKALATAPSFIVLDEPTSSLDVSVQSQIINDLKNLQKDLNLTYIFISHDLNVVRYMSSQIAVMYLGKIVELAGEQSLYQSPRHPYTQALSSANPSVDLEHKSKRAILSGEVPSPIDVPRGCRFHVRCAYATSKCATDCPELIEVTKDHFVACHRESAR